MSRVGDHHVSRPQQRRLAALGPVRPAEPAPKPVAGNNTTATDTASKALNQWTRTPTLTHLTHWKAIRKAKPYGLYPLAISRELGISRAPCASMPTPRNRPLRAYPDNS